VNDHLISRQLQRRRCREFRWVGLLAVALAASACGKAPPPTLPPFPPPAPLTIAASPEAKVKAPMTLSASADTNPDASGRPSPVVVRVYQLRTDASFNGAEFFALFDDDQKVLGPELITRDEFVLAPSERRTIEVTVAGDARFVGAVAAFRDIRNSQWRVVVPAPRTGMTIDVQRARIVLSVAAE
jgi:type VI secretion system protein VasD